MSRFTPAENLQLKYCLENSSTPILHIPNGGRGEKVILKIPESKWESWITNEKKDNQWTRRLNSGSSSCSVWIQEYVCRLKGHRKPKLSAPFRQRKNYTKTVGCGAGFTARLSQKFWPGSKTDRTVVLTCYWNHNHEAPPRETNDDHYTRIEAKESELIDLITPQVSGPTESPRHTNISGGFPESDTKELNESQNMRDTLGYDITYALCECNGIRNDNAYSISSKQSTTNFPISEVSQDIEIPHRDRVINIAGYVNVFQKQGLMELLARNRIINLTKPKETVTNRTVTTRDSVNPPEFSKQMSRSTRDNIEIIGNRGVPIMPISNQRGKLADITNVTHKKTTTNKIVKTNYYANKEKPVPTCTSPRASLIQTILNDVLD
ncbi:hypothetical protein DFJ63DRAFT_310448 [Scheffersomyces coipomensis]|uniref:uncharacterized protein n=1 Tax=Scheffersomyces coipomensis TaxID=1788519 RepID=UPI00315DB963